MQTPALRKVFRGIGEHLRDLPEDIAASKLDDFEFMLVAALARIETLSSTIGSAAIELRGSLVVDQLCNILLAPLSAETATILGRGEARAKIPSSPIFNLALKDAS